MEFSIAVAIVSGSAVAVFDTTRLLLSMKMKNTERFVQDFLHNMSIIFVQLKKCSKREINYYYY